MTAIGSRAAARPVPTASASTRPRPDAGAARRKREARAAFFFLLPDSLGLLVFVFVPMLLAIALGFFSLDGFGNLEFIGGANYVRMFGDPQFLQSAAVTAVYLVALVPLIFVISLALALLVQQRIPLVGFIRSALFAPYVVSIVVVGLIWQFMLADRVGVLNQFLAAFGVRDVSWLGDPQYTLGTVVVISIWFQMGYYMVIFLAGLQDIPSEYYESARIDGASAWQRFRSITLPLLRPTSLFVFITVTIAVITGGFDLIYIMTGGGPAGSTSLLIYYVYEQAFLFGEYGYAAAIGSVLILVLLLWSAFMFRITRGGRIDDGE
ncbi:multiple sugar transport system permease protein [Diaminobutyricimonas aerilata]|uniref:Multiple sugar transport system permease protein n=1 Tax=Diaminobutyricimonas aerilata TaxID=1162967 RepID=A0A2M9CHK6_9MICO|nr:sugar ABC transporter permease [Diaminobutyricimonas aerilata]PJJ71368.1 multiple sugar transport system permease protein [Diaminobutyricimonas aerilata]